MVLFLKKESLPSLLSYLFFFLIIISKFLIDKPIIFNPKDKPPEILHPDIKISFPYEFIKIWQSQISFTTLYTIKSNPRFLPFNFFFSFRQSKQQSNTYHQIPKFWKSIIPNSSQFTQPPHTLSPHIALPRLSVIWTVKISKNSRNNVWCSFIWLQKFWNYSIAHFNNSTIHLQSRHIYDSQDMRPWFLVSQKIK